jgi:cytochrome oxidase Cu insertion factor (SCO1/SenC/PrrC family)
MQSNSAAKIKSNKRTLIIVLLIFVFPVIISFSMYITGWRPSSSVNYGELILPVHPVEDRLMQSIEGKQVKISELNGKWTMLYFDSSACPESCISQLYFMRQIHASQGKNYDRMQRVFVLTDTKSVDGLSAKLSDYPDMKVWSGVQAVLNSLARDFGFDAQAASQRIIYLMDPQGNLMMRYKPGAEPAGVRKDIERLLKYSNEK